MDYFPEIVQVIPHDNYTVTVYFHDGKIVVYDLSNLLDTGIFIKLKDIKVFKDTCMILNDTLAWDIGGNKDVYNCIDIDPETLYNLPAMQFDSHNISEIA